MARLLNDLYMFSGMGQDDKPSVAQRLKALRDELGYSSTVDFAGYMARERGTVDAWLQGRALIPVHDARRLVDDHGITLEWLYYNEARHMPHALLIRLIGRMNGDLVPDREYGVEAEAVKDLLGRSGYSARRPRTTMKTAT